MTAFPTGCDERMVWHYDDNSGVCTNADMDVPGDTTYENVDECCADYMWSTDCDIVDVCAPTPSPSTGGLTDKPVFIWKGTPSPTVRKVPPEVGETPVPSPPPTLSDNEPTVRCSLSLFLFYIFSLLYVKLMKLVSNNTILFVQSLLLTCEHTHYTTGNPHV